LWVGERTTRPENFEKSFGLALRPAERSTLLKNDRPRNQGEKEQDAQYAACHNAGLID
jgi:hypothetical protein